MASGTVKWFSPHIGFGFIHPPNGGNDLLVTGEAVNDAELSTLNEGQQVRYEISGLSTGRQSAINLSLIHAKPMVVA